MIGEKDLLFYSYLSNGSNIKGEGVKRNFWYIRFTISDGFYRLFYMFKGMKNGCGMGSKSI